MKKIFGCMLIVSLALSIVTPSNSFAESRDLVTLVGQVKADKTFTMEQVIVIHCYNQIANVSTSFFSEQADVLPTGYIEAMLLTKPDTKAKSIYEDTDPYRCNRYNNYSVNRLALNNKAKINFVDSDPYSVC